MKFPKILTVAAIAGLLMASSACSAPNKPESSASAAQMSTIEEPVTDRKIPTGDGAHAAEVVSDFYAYISDPANLSKIKEASAPIRGHGKKSTEDELASLVAALPDGFRFFDTSSPDLIKNAYVQLSMGARALSTDAVKLQIFNESVNVDGSSATVKMVKTEVLPKIQKPRPLLNSGMPEVILGKNDSGKWVMKAEPLPGMSSNSGFAAAADS